MPLILYTLNVFNLRGNCRTSGELRRKEGGNVFGLGSRTPISITLLVKNPASNQKTAEIHYRDIGDYLPQPDKLTKIKELGSILNPAMELSSIMPNEAHDWLNQRDGLFETFIPIGDKDDKTGKTVFVPCYSCGVKTNRDSWVYNFSKESLEKNMSSMIDFYNDNVEELQIARKNDPVYKGENVIKLDPTKISWTRGLRNDFEKIKTHPFRADCFRIATYRPFVKLHYYFDRCFNDMVYQIPRLFPTPQTKNLVICVPGIGAKKGFSALMVNCIPDVQLQYNGQCFPMWYYEPVEKEQLGLFDESEGDYVRRDGISDFILQRAREQYGPKCTSSDIFYYVYGLLHSPDYRKRFEADLTKMLPRIPFIEDVKSFREFSKIGKELAEIHLDYENIEPWSEAIVTGDVSSLHVDKMRFAKTDGEDDKRTICLSPDVKVENIPLHAYDYIINGKSAIEWLMERYSFSVHSESQIANDPNAWGKEHNQPQYILNLLLRMISVSMKTLKLVSKLPRIDFPNC